LEETQCDSKLNCVFQMLSHIINSSSAKRKWHSEYTHNYGRKNIIEDCEDISLELGLYYIYIEFSINCYLSSCIQLQSAMSIKNKSTQNWHKNLFKKEKKSKTQKDARAAGR